MPSLVRKKSKTVATIVSNPGKKLPVPHDEEGYDIALTKSGWEEYFRLMEKWERGGYTSVQRIFQTANRGGTSWVAFIYLFKKGGGQKLEIETIIRAPSPDLKRKFRNDHNDRLEPLTHIHSFIP